MVAFEIDGFTIVRDGHRLFMEVEGAKMPATLRMEIAIQLHAELERCIGEFQRENGASAIRAELAIVPLCELCTRYDLPRHDPAH